MTYRKKHKQKKQTKIIIAVIVVLLAIIVLISTTQQTTTQGEDMTTVTITTNKGVITAELYTDKAPITTSNFIDLAQNNFYDGLTFHRYEPGFVIQGGDPLGTGTGGSDKRIPLEVHPELTHVEGVLAMARSSDPNSARSQFYITLAPAHFLDGSYAVFGKVTSGMDVVKELRAGDTMTTIEVNS